MPITRKWLSWDEPCLPQAAAWLIDRFTGGSECDLRQALCVLPGSRAGRLLLKYMLDVCAARGIRLIPPRVLTPGAMVDEILLALNDDAPPIASAHESHLAWIAGLRATDQAHLESLIPETSAADDWRAWSALAKTLQSLHEALSGEMRDFEAAGEAAANMNMPNECERWQSIAAVHAQQRAALARAGLVDRHDARSQSLAKLRQTVGAGSCASRTIVLIGAADLNAIQKAILWLPGLDVHALVHAPESEHEGFDDVGTVRTEAWLTRPLDVVDAQIAVAERSPNQAQEAMRFLASLNGEFAPTDITLGLGDASLMGDLRVAAQWAGFAIHDPTGTVVDRSPPWRMLETAADWLDEPRFEHLATLLRHVDVERWVALTARMPADQPADPDVEVDRTSDDDVPREPDEQVQLAHVEWLTLLDEYFAAHLQGRLTGSWLGRQSTRVRLRAVYAAVQGMLAPLNADSKTCRPLADWCQPLLDVLANVYAMDDGASSPDGADAVDDEKRRAQTPAALRAIDAVLVMRDALQDVAASAPQLQPSVNAATALRLLLDHLADAVVRPEREPRSVEALGWLELHLDPAPALCIVGFNDGAVPESVTGHAFVPDGLRTALGMLNNARRYARDAYLLQAIAHSRQLLKLIVGRRSAQGDPLAPSRLLLACDDATLVRRVRDFAEDHSAEPERPIVGLPASDSHARSQFVVPSLPPLAAPAFMRVTEFGMFLRCPYRYALARLLDLQAFADDDAELDPMSFGSLAHQALSALGDDAAIAASDDHEQIFGFLQERLREHVRRTFGSQPLPAVRLQIARLEQRLRSFSRFQAREVRDGWRVRHCELQFGEKEGGMHVELDVPGQPSMPIRGRIDRIDHHEPSGAWRIIDYKTSESAKSPYKTHHDRRKAPDGVADLAWCDLQLPLYFLLATRSALALPAERIELGYIALPKQSGGVEWHAAKWTAEQIAHGLDAARDVVRAIRRGDFNVDRMQRDIDPEFDDFARICQTEAFKSDDEDEEDDA